MLNMELFPAAAQEQDVLARDEVDQWQWDLKEEDPEGRFAFEGMMF